MRVFPHLKTLIALASLATFVACAGYGRQGRGGVTVVSVRWDSGPLDRDYGRVHADMVARHQHEDESPRSDESAEYRHKRHDAEAKDVDKRYEKGKKEHRDTMPASDN
jgi:hypothetical protein